MTSLRYLSASRVLLSILCACRFSILPKSNAESSLWPIRRDVVTCRFDLIFHGMTSSKELVKKARQDVTIQKTRSSSGITTSTSREYCVLFVGSRWLSAKGLEWQTTDVSLVYFYLLLSPYSADITERKYIFSVKIGHVHHLLVITPFSKRLILVATIKRKVGPCNSARIWWPAIVMDPLMSTWGSKAFRGYQCCLFCTAFVSWQFISPLVSIPSSGSNLYIAFR